MTFRGDAGLFRGCLMLAGFCELADYGTIYNDKQPNGSRNLKLWNAGGMMWHASSDIHQTLRGYLKEAFGDRYIYSGVRQSENWFGDTTTSYVVKLRD